LSSIGISIDVALPIVTQPIKNSSRIVFFISYRKYTKTFFYFCCEQKNNMSTAILKTAKGDLKIEFFEKDAPNTVANFIKLAKEGFYDGIAFHRVIPDFVVQAGCPYSKSEVTAFKAGSGGPGYMIDCELTGENQFHDRGVLSMAHAGRNTGGSQFFICHSRANTAHLDRNHTVFGKVIENVDLVDAIAQGDSIIGITVTE
jgi:peptidyl-prolyl cis-trans isomerase B (cyclophilin B)